MPPSKNTILRGKDQARNLSGGAERAVSLPGFLHRRTREWASLGLFSCGRRGGGSFRMSAAPQASLTAVGKPHLGNNIFTAKALLLGGFRCFSESFLHSASAFGSGPFHQKRGRIQRISRAGSGRLRPVCGGEYFLTSAGKCTIVMGGQKGCPTACGLVRAFE